MADIIAPFLIRYRGKRAHNHILDAREYGESIVGASKLYSMVAHYTMFGEIPHPRTKKQLVCFAKAPEPGSLDQWIGLAAAVAGQYGVDAAIYGEALSWAFGRIMGAIINLWTRPGDSETIIQEIADDMHEKANADPNMALLLANGIIQANKDLKEANVEANKNLALLFGQLIEQLPNLAANTRRYGKDFVRPVGSSCSCIDQFAGTQFESNITEADAEVIRGGDDMEVEPTQDYKVNMISEINLKTKHCVLEVEGIDSPVAGLISDPVLDAPRNIYTRSLDERTGFIVIAKAVKQSGEIKKLHSSDARPRNGT